jgi:hypothetical protein
MTLLLASAGTLAGEQKTCTLRAGFLLFSTTSVGGVPEFIIALGTRIQAWQKTNN